VTLKLSEARAITVLRKLCRLPLRSRPSLPMALSHIRPMDRAGLGKLIFRYFIVPPFLLDIPHHSDGHISCFSRRVKAPETSIVGLQWVLHHAANLCFVALALPTDIEWLPCTKEMDVAGPRSES
jgi:hypothetical protein